MLQRLFTIINFDKVVQAYLVITPIIWLPAIQQNNIQFMLFNYGAMILLALALSLPIKRQTDNALPFVSLLLIAVISIWANITGFSIGFLHVTSAIALYYAILLGVKDYKSVIRAILLMAAINIVIATLQKSGFYIIYFKEIYSEADIPGAFSQSFFNCHVSMPGLMGRNYLLSYMLIFVTPLAFLINKLFGIVLYIITTIFAMLIGSYACILSLVVMTAYLASKYIKWRVLAIIGIIALSTICFIKKDLVVYKINTRVESYRYIVNESLVNPFRGKGLGTFDFNVNIESADRKFESSYNQYLRIPYEISWAAFIAIIYMFFSYLLKLKSSRYFTASFIAMAVYPMFHEVLRFARLDILFIAILAANEIQCLERRQKNEVNS